MNIEESNLPSGDMYLVVSIIARTPTPERPSRTIKPINASNASITRKLTNKCSGFICSLTLIIRNEAGILARKGDNLHTILFAVPALRSLLLQYIYNSPLEKERH